MCHWGAHCWLQLALVLWLLLTVARQLFDLIGRLWIPVAFNLLQMLFCISGLFAVCQYRPCLLFGLTVSSVLSAAYNVFIVLWYNDLLGDRTRPLLSAGLPYSYSFFVRHTPSCQSHFNLSSSRWVQSPCAVPYHRVESLQAFVHLMLATITVLLSAMLLRDRSHTKRCGDRVSMSQPKITVEYAGPPNDCPLQPKGCGASRFSSEFNVGGFMNSSFDETAEREVFGEPRAARPPPGDRATHSTRRTRPKAPRPPLSAPVLLQKEKDCGSLSASAVDATFRQSGRLSRNADNAASASKYADEQWSDSEDPYAKPRARSASVKSFKMAAAQGVPRMLSHEQLSTDCDFDDRNSARRLSGSNLTALISFDPKSSTLIRVREHVDDESDEEIYEGLCGRDGLLYSPSSAVPMVNAPPPPTLPAACRPVDMSSSDSGVPSSTSNPAEWMPSDPISSYSMVARESASWHDALPSPPLSKARPPIGYEPALCDPPLPLFDTDLTRLGGTQLLYEPVYRRAAQISSDRKSSIGHYQEPNSLRLMAYESEPRGAPATVPIINNNSLLV